LLLLLVALDGLRSHPRPTTELVDTKLISLWACPCKSDGELILNCLLRAWRYDSATANATNAAVASKATKATLARQSLSPYRRGIGSNAKIWPVEWLGWWATSDRGAKLQEGILTLLVEDPLSPAVSCW
jgi:hypothetical protein